VNGNGSNFPSSPIDGNSSMFFSSQSQSNFPSMPDSGEAMAHQGSFLQGQT